MHTSGGGGVQPKYNRVLPSSSRKSTRGASGLRKIRNSNAKAEINCHEKATSCLFEFLNKASFRKRLRIKCINHLKMH